MLWSTCIIEGILYVPVYVLLLVHVLYQEHSVQVHVETLYQKTSRRHNLPGDTVYRYTFKTFKIKNFQNIINLDLIASTLYFSVLSIIFFFAMINPRTRRLPVRVDIMYQ